MSTKDLLQQLRQKVMAENIAKQSAADTNKLIDALEIVPQHKMLEDAQYLMNDLVPRIQRSKGEDSAEYKFFRGLIDTIMWSIFIMERYENLLQKFQHTELLSEIYKGRMDLAERELLKYTTIEDLTRSNAIKDFQEAIMKRSEDWVNSIIKK